MPGPAGEVLLKARKDWRKNPVEGFFVFWPKNHNGTINLLRWECLIPGPRRSPWAGGLYRMNLQFTENFPLEPPECCFTPPLYHPNIYRSGRVCSSLFTKNWNSSVSVREIIIAMHHLLGEPNFSDIAQLEPSQAYSRNGIEFYEAEVRKQAAKFARDIVLRQMNIEPVLSAPQPVPSTPQPLPLTLQLLPLTPRLLLPTPQFFSPTPQLVPSTSKPVPPTPQSVLPTTEPVPVTPGPVPPTMEQVIPSPKPAQEVLATPVGIPVSDVDLLAGTRPIRLRKAPRRYNEYY